MVDQGNCAEIMYPDLYRWLNLKPEDLIAYDSLLVSFDGKLVTLKGQIRLLVQASSKVVEVDFIVADACSPYTAIVARSWLHTFGVVSSNLHQKVKYSSEDRIEELVGNQSMARQCLVSAILLQPIAESLESVKEGFIVVKVSRITCKEASWGGQIWRFREIFHWWWSGKNFLGWSSVTTSGERGFSGISQEEHWCICLECLRSSVSGSELYMPSFECQFICHP